MADTDSIMATLVDLQKRIERIESTLSYVMHPHVIPEDTQEEEEDEQ